MSSSPKANPSRYFTEPEIPPLNKVLTQMKTDVSVVDITLWVWHLVSCLDNTAVACISLSLPP